jgi:uncharacterized protein (TIGR02646 family)
MKGDNAHGGDIAYADCRRELIQGQGGICAYCEIDIRDNDPLKCRVEHFHPKSDNSSPHNWGLDWQNMLAVCAGGSYRHGYMPHSLEPLAENLSCDAYKDFLIQSKKLPQQCEGVILEPTGLPALINLFAIEKSTGRLISNAEACAVAPKNAKNKHADLATLVNQTIISLNLNCDRLCQVRLSIIHDIERNKKRQRDAGFGPAQGLQNLVDRYFRRPWPGFFTTIRICLGAAAEGYLETSGFSG